MKSIDSEILEELNCMLSCFKVNSVSLLEY